MTLSSVAYMLQLEVITLKNINQTQFNPITNMFPLHYLLVWGLIIYGIMHLATNIYSLFQGPEENVLKKTTTNLQSMSTHRRSMRTQEGRSK